MTTPPHHRESRSEIPPRDAESCDVAVIGGGISGLVAGFRLARAGAGVQVLESSDRIGGAIHSLSREEGLLELGPFSVMVRSPEFRDLLDELDLKPVTIDAGRSRKRYIQLNGDLRLLPGSVPGLLGSNLLSLRGRFDLLRSVISNRMRGEAIPSNLHEFGTRRFGAEFANHVVGPGTMGIFGAEARELETEACLPEVHRTDGISRTTIGLVRSLRKTAASGPPRRLMSLEGGLSSLTDRLASQLAGSVRTATRVTRIIRRVSGFEIHHSGGRPLQAGSVILTTGPEATAELVADMHPQASEVIRQIKAAGLGVVHLIFDEEQVGRQLDGFGYLVPEIEPDMNPVLGVIWPGSVFPGQATKGRTIIRVMVGGTRWPDALNLDDQTLVHRCLDRIRSIHRIEGEPRSVEVTRWPASVPVYEPGHADRIRSIEDSVSKIPGLRLAGSWICPPRGGVGVNDRVRHACEVAADLLDHHHTCWSEDISASAPHPPPDITRGRNSA